ncbi:hypothetical protein QBC44DRAFT_402784 [Cladorrhinum sp. PSN332]|nr:hypothetical protein QBC44DRAFT_402784 [Cladorrhinum sp. PSN332]
MKSRLLLLSLVLHSGVALAAQQKIASFPGFSTQRPCAKQCFGASISTLEVDLLGQNIGCQVIDYNTYRYQAADVDCYCRADLQSKAHDYLSSCISSTSITSNSYGCGGLGDFSRDEQTAIAIYDSYCESVRGPVPSSSSSGSGSGGTSGGGSSGGGTSTNSGGTNDSTSTNNNNNQNVNNINNNNNNNNNSGSSDSKSNEDKDGLSKSDIIAIATSIPSAIGLLVTAFGCWRRRQKKKKGNMNEKGGQGVASHGPAPLPTYAPPQVNMGWNNAWHHQHRQPRYNGNGWR